MRQLFFFFSIMLWCAGCGAGNSVSNAASSVSTGFQETFGSVPHRNWGSYNLYRFQGGTWVKFVSLGTATGPLPDLGTSPVMVVHGLGSSIRTDTFSPLAQALQAGGATGVVGFEYDTLDSVRTNGGYLTQAYTLLAQNAPGRTWRHVGHSMGALVSRVAFESGSQFPVAVTGNKAVFAAGPHLGTPIADAIQNDSDGFRQALQYLTFHNVMEFTNSDFARCDVDGREPGFTDLRDQGTFVTSLNVGAATHHPQWEYRTVAGDRRGPDFETIDALLKVFVDDGIVNTVSAHAPVIGQVEVATVGQDHASIIETNPGVSTIAQFLR